MSQPTATILLTRPMMQSQRFADACIARFGKRVSILISPLLEIRISRDQAPLTGYSGLIFTSENGVRAFEKNWPGIRLPAWCVGDRTAKAASRIGLETQSAKGNAANLISRIIADAPEGRLLHLRGEYSRGNVAAKLRAAGIGAEERIVYRQIACKLTSAARGALQGDRNVILPLFSPRSAALFVDQAESCMAEVSVVAVSTTVADVLRGCKFGKIIVTDQPVASAVLDDMARLIDARGLLEG